MTEIYRNFTNLLDDFLKDHQFAADFLIEALDEDDIRVFLMSLKDVVSVRGSLSSFFKQKLKSKIR